MNLELDPSFEQNIVSVFGDDGRAWLERLPQLLDDYAGRWGLDIGAPFPLSYNYVAPAMRRDGTSAVLKAGAPRDDIAHEFAALRHWDGDGVVRVYEADIDAGVALIERVEPGDRIAGIDDDDATAVAADLMRRLFAHGMPTSHAFPTLEDWGRAFGELRARHHGRGLEPAAVFDRGAALYRELTAGHVPRVLLHGDLHHDNILRGTREPWLVIDPHGVVGPRGFEVGAWLRNPMGALQDGRSEGDVLRLLDRRLEIFASVLQMERGLLRDWGIAVCCLSAAWSDESGHAGHVAETMRIAELLTTL